MQSGDTASTEFLDKLAVRATLEAYFSSVDRRDWLTYGQCFTEDAQFELHGGDVQIVVGRDAIVQRAEQRLNRPVSNHLLSNTHISTTGNRATAVTHALAHLVVPGNGGTRIVVRGIVYEDELVAHGALAWKISKRVHRPLWQFDATAMPLGY